MRRQCEPRESAHSDGDRFTYIRQRDGRAEFWSRGDRFRIGQHANRIRGGIGRRLLFVPDCTQRRISHLYHFGRYVWRWLLHVDRELYVGPDERIAIQQRRGHGHGERHDLQSNRHSHGRCIQHFGGAKPDSDRQSERQRSRAGRIGGSDQRQFHVSGGDAQFRIGGDLCFTRLAGSRRRTR